MSGYFLKGRQCKVCHRYEGTSPDGKRDRGIDASGICADCRAAGKRVRAFKMVPTVTRIGGHDFPGSRAVYDDDPEYDTLP